jgi:hypothetical protein
MSRVGRRDRVLAWIVTGPVGRGVAFAVDFAVALANAVFRRGRYRDRP